MLVEGNPSRVRALNQVGLKRAGLIEREGGKVFQALKKTFRILYRSGLTLTQALDQIEPLIAFEPVEHLYTFLKTSQQPHRRGPTVGR
jgi:UDP-N-acetylglucosamine acyltransferase